MLSTLSPLAQRFITSGVFVAIIAFAIYHAHTPSLQWLPPVLTAAVAVIASKEYFSIATLKGLQPAKEIGMTLALLYILFLDWFGPSPKAEALPLAFLFISIAAVSGSYLRGGKDPVLSIASSVFPIPYLAIPLGCLLQIIAFFPSEAAQDGRWWLIYLLAITYITDSSALFFGKTLGRHPLAPLTSPNKTQEGAIGGFACAILCSLAFAYFAHQGWIPMQLNYLHALGLGMILSVLAQLGDLAESLLKRDAKIKDSSKIPGLGGMLDVVDSLLFTAPLLYLYLKFSFIHHS